MTRSPVDGTPVATASVDSNTVAPRRASPRARTRLPPWLLPLLPIFVFVGAVLLWPMVQSIVDSGRVDGRWNLGAYQEVFRDRVFRSAVGYTLLFTLCTIVIEFGLGLGAALLLDRLREPWKRIVTTAALLPYLVAPVAVGLIWRLILDYRIGTVNWGLGLIGVPKVNWLGSTTPAFWATIAAEVWRSTPFVLIILVAGLTAMPNDIMEAGQIDGASRSQLFWHIKFPLLRPAIAVALLFSTIFKLRLFELPFILTGGGPGDSTTPLGLVVYQYYFRYFEAAPAAVVSVVLLAMGSVIAYGYIRWVYREVDYR